MWIIYHIWLLNRCQFDMEQVFLYLAPLNMWGNKTLIYPMLHDVSYILGNRYKTDKLIQHFLNLVPEPRIDKIATAKFLNSITNHWVMLITWNLSYDVKYMTLTGHILICRLGPKSYKKYLQHLWIQLLEVAVVFGVRAVNVTRWHQAHHMNPLLSLIWNWDIPIAWLILSSSIIHVCSWIC